MNYLAHAFLSFNHPQVLLGNMISDFVKGQLQYQYPAAVQAGIVLHREIDRFTDAHPATKEMAAIFKPQYRLYSGAIADVLYDYYLANDRSLFESREQLMLFTEQCFKDLQANEKWFPTRFASMFSYMREQNWLYHYQFHWGVQKSLQGLTKRAKYMPDSKPAFELFLANEAIFKNCYQAFFPDVKKHAIQIMAQFSID